MILPKRKHPYSLSPVWWFWFPVLLAAGLAVINPLARTATLELIYAENGLLEIPQAFIALAAAGVALNCLRFCRKSKWLVAWVGAGFLGCLYIDLEEISYGQHIFEWGTPEYWRTLNDQEETNLHNTSSWFDQKPRTLLLVGTFVGGILIPFLRWKKPALLPSRFELIYPENAMFWTSLAAFLSHWTSMLKKKDIVEIYFRGSETTETFLYYFILLYLLFLLPKLKKTSSVGQ